MDAEQRQYEIEKLATRLENIDYELQAVAQSHGYQSKEYEQLEEQQDAVEEQLAALEDEMDYEM